MTREGLQMSQGPKTTNKTPQSRTHASPNSTETTKKAHQESDERAHGKYVLQSIHNYNLGLYR